MKILTPDQSTNSAGGPASAAKPWTETPREKGKEEDQL